MPAEPKQQAFTPSNVSLLTVSVKSSMSTKSFHDSILPPHLSKPTSKSAYPSNTAPAHQTNGAPVNKQPTDTMPVPVNRKKQKRRQKLAARLAAERQVQNGHIATDVADGNGQKLAGDEPDVEDTRSYDGHAFSANGDEDGEDDHVTIDAHYDLQAPSGISWGNGHQQTVTSKKSKKKQGKKGRSGSQTLADETSTSLSTPSISMSHPLPPRLASHVSRLSTRKSNKPRSIWNTTTQEERENIKTFWLELGEDERRQLVKVEKDAVLKKMKEQQKHSCSCTVCGRKRTAIEEELEVLYDAYYEELEQYANNNQSAFDKGSPIPPRLCHSSPRSPGRRTHIHTQFHPSRGHVEELPEGVDELEGEYDEEEDDGEESYSEDDSEDEATRAARADFFAFGNSLTVKDGILTVADDLLKNDGKHFIDMMEQLAERRMQREEDTQYGMAAAHQSLHGHSHGPLDDDDDYDDDDDEEEEYDSQDEEDYEEDEMDAMTEEQRMEEGRRMFQIFAARMFEQRVLTAYREKVALQRQQKLLEELIEEETRNEQRTAKKARDAQKKKDKKRLQKQAKEEERARREAEKAAEEAAARAEQEKKLEEQRKKREEQRKKREAEKKAQDEERARREAEKQRRLKEERERHAEAERKQREMKEQERKRREEATRKEREEREAREKENREKKAQEDRQRKAREEQARKDKADQELKERQKRDAQSASQQTQAKRASQSGPVPIPPSPFQHQFHSPHFQVATPVVPKAPTPARPRQPSQHGSHTSSPRSQPASATQSQLSVSPRSIPLSQTSGTSSATSVKGSEQQPALLHPQPSAPLSPLGAGGRVPPPGFPAFSGLPSHPPGIPGMVPRPPIGHELPMYPPHSGPIVSPFRGFPAPNGIPVPPGINGARPIPPGRGFPLDPGHGLPFHGPQPIPNAFSAQPSGLSQAHSRQASNSFERSPLEAHSQPYPISRPSPIKRPSSTTPRDQKDEATQKDVDGLSAHLGSSALLDDTAIPCTSNLSQSLPGTAAPGLFPGPARASFGASSLFPDPLTSKHANFPVVPGVGGTWGAQIPFGPSAFPGSPAWGSGTGGGWSNNAFSAGGHHRAHASRPVTIRLLVIQACKQLNTMSPGKGADGFHDVNLVLRQVDQLRTANEPPISLKEMLDICDTEGNPQNGGGSFLIKDDKENGKFVKFEPDNNSSVPGHRGSIVPGEIGSPVPGSSVPVLGGIGNPSSSTLRKYSSPPTGF